MFGIERKLAYLVSVLLVELGPIETLPSIATGPKQNRPERQTRLQLMACGSLDREVEMGSLAEPPPNPAPRSLPENPRALHLQLAPRATRLSHPRMLRGLAGGLGLIACSCAGPAQHPPGSAQAQHCQVRLSGSQPTLAAAGTISPPSSTLVVSAAIGRDQLLSELAAHIPVTLAHEKDRPIGAPGRVTYTVTRGAMSARIENAGVSVTTLANAAIQVCKPLGPFCVTYGRCQPVLATTVHVPLLLDEDYAWRRPTSSVRAERGCAIAGFDVTPRLTSLASSNLERINNQVAASLPEVKPWAQRIWQLATNPVFLDGRHCLRLSPRGFLQAPPKQTSSGFEHRLGVQLALELSERCSGNQSQAEPPKLSALRTVDELSQDSELVLTQTMSESRLASELTKTLKGSFAEGEHLESIGVQAVRVAEKNVLLVRADLNGVTCGSAWLTAQLAPGKHGTWSLRDVQFSEPRAGEVPGLIKHIETRSSVRPELGFKDAAGRLRDIVGALTDLATEHAANQARDHTQQRLQIIADWGEPTLSQARVSEQGVQLAATLPLKARLSLRRAKQ